jgi:hypothetical protein
MEGAAANRPAAPTSTASAGIAMSLATFAMAAASGIQAVLYLDAFGIGGRTDGFFIAFGLYATFGIFSQSIRVTSVPLLVGYRARLGPRELAVVLIAIAVPVAVATIPLAKPFAALLAPGLDGADRAVTESALPLLGGAMVLQLWAAGAATLLAVRSRFAAIARAYAVGSAAGLLAFVVALGPADELSLAWSMLAMAVVTCGLAVFSAARSRPAGPERPPGPLRIGDAISRVPLVLGRTTIYLAFNGLYVITIAFVSNSQAGDATLLSYAYLGASYLVSGTAFALGMGQITELRRAAISDRAQALADSVEPGFRYSILVVAPAFMVLVLCVPTLAGALLPASLDAGDVARLRLFEALLATWTLFALAVNLLLPAMLALGRARFANALAVPLVAVQVIVTAAASAAFGASGAVGAFFVAPAFLACALAVAGAKKQGAIPLAAALGRDTARFGGAAVGAFGIAWLAAHAVSGGTTAAVLCGVLGAVSYAALLPRLAPREVAFALEAIRRRGGGGATEAPQKRPRAASAPAAVDA